MYGNANLNREAWPKASEVLLRHTIHGATWCALPVVVISDTHEGVVVRIKAGLNWLAAHRIGGGERAHGWERRWELKVTKWTKFDVTYIIPWGRWFGIALFTRPDSQKIEQWYVNCQDPLRRMNWGFDTMDRELDIVQNLGGGRPMLKDKWAFTRIVREHVFDRAYVAQLIRDARCASSAIQDPGMRNRMSAWISDITIKIPDLERVVRNLTMPDDINIDLIQFGEV